MRNLDNNTQVIRSAEWSGKTANCRWTYRMLGTQTFLLARL